MVCNHVKTLHGLIWYLDSFGVGTGSYTRKEIDYRYRFPFLNHYSHPLRKHAHIFIRVSTGS